SPADAPPPMKDRTVDIFCSIGEANEVREVLRRCLARGIPLDHVEILHTDSTTYLPLIYEVFWALETSDAGNSGELPVTFAEGISSRYSRPGRALIAWLSWIREGYPQANLVRLIREGIVTIPSKNEQSFSQLAAALRDVPIGI